MSRRSTKQRRAARRRQLVYRYAEMTCGRWVVPAARLTVDQVRKLADGGWTPFPGAFVLRRA